MTLLSGKPGQAKPAQQKLGSLTLEDVSPETITTHYSYHPFAASITSRKQILIALITPKSTSTADGVSRKTLNETLNACKIFANPSACLNSINDAPVAEGLHGNLEASGSFPVLTHSAFQWEILRD